MHYEVALFGALASVLQLVHYYSTFDFLEANVVRLLWGLLFFFVAWEVFGLMLCGVIARYISGLRPWERISASK